MISENYFRGGVDVSNALMIIGLLGMVTGIIAPVFKVLNKKSRRSGWAAAAVVVSFVLFIAGVWMGL